MRGKEGIYTTVINIGVSMKGAAAGVLQPCLC